MFVVALSRSKLPRRTFKPLCKSYGKCHRMLTTRYHGGLLQAAVFNFISSAVVLALNQGRSHATVSPVANHPLLHRLYRKDYAPHGGRRANAACAPPILDNAGLPLAPPAGSASGWPPAAEGNAEAKLDFADADPLTPVTVAPEPAHG